MGQRGRLQDYPKLLKFSCTESQEQFVKDLAALQGVSVPEALRRLVDAAFAQALLKEAFDG